MFLFRTYCLMRNGDSYRDQQKPAFTVIELLVVISVIGLISSIILISVKATRDKARIVKGLNFNAQIHHALGDKLIAEWKFNDNLIDSSENDHDGLWKGTASSPPNDHFVDSLSQLGGKALNFNGVDEYVEIPYSKNLLPESLTIQAWIKPAQILQDWETRIILGNTRHYTLLIKGAHGGKGNGICFFLHFLGSASRCVETDKIKPGKWYHVVGTYDAEKRQTKVYIDGELIYTDNMLGGSFDATPIPTRIAGYPGFGYNVFDGVIDDVRLYEGSF